MLTGYVEQSFTEIGMDCHATKTHKNTTLVSCANPWNRKGQNMIENMVGCAFIGLAYVLYELAHKILIFYFYKNFNFSKFL